MQKRQLSSLGNSSTIFWLNSGTRHWFGRFIELNNWRSQSVHSQYSGHLDDGRKSRRRLELRNILLQTTQTLILLTP